MKKKPFQIVNVVGARPNFIKIAPLIEEQKKYPKIFSPILVHTDQHYNFNLSQQFFKELHIPAPDIHLAVGAGSPIAQIAKIMAHFEKMMTQVKPSLVIVVGDVNSTLACALVANKLHIPIAHIEAGLRSGNQDMPEEVNRIVVDRISQLLFATERSAVYNLQKEGIAKKQIHLVGNVMIDTLKKFKNAALTKNTARKLRLNGYLLLTLHRPENVDSKKTLTQIIDLLKHIHYQIVFPMHPRTKKRIQDHNLYASLTALKSVQIIPPLGYLDFLNLEMNAMAVMTDSGGVQEETTALGIPCLTLRNETERPITVEEGTNTVVGLNKAKILNLLSQYCDNPQKHLQILPRYWDGNSSKRIVAVIIKYLYDLHN
jgi:UDP-N-acetylglucosamine 2-epimerase (non-hydrolysing)